MRWAFRFAMRWLYDSHRETFMRNVESIQDLMSLQELLEVTTFCLVPMDDELFGILAAYERHFQSKGANYRMKDSYQRAYKTEGWRNQQRQAFADAKQIPLSELFVPKYVADEYYTKILNLRDEEKNVHMSLRGNVLFLKVRDIFVDGLNLELRDLHEGSRNSFDSKRIVGIYAKWAPSLKHHHDKALGMGRAIAEKLAVELGWVADTDEMTQAAWKQFVRYRYHHDVLSPIRRAAKVPESFIGRGEWHLIDYNRVSSWCMQTQKKLFVKHDAEGLATFMNDVVSGGAKIHTGKLLPAAIFKDCISAYVESDSGVFSKRLIEMYLSEEFGTEDSVTDGSGMDTIQENPCSMLSTMQWDSMCAEMLRKTTHKNPRVNCMIPIIDNMSVEYQLTAVSFSLLLAQCSHPESLFHKRIISCCGVKAAIHSITGEYGETCVDAAKSILISIMLGNYCDINEPYASVYDSIDLVVRDALHNGVTDEELATWTFVVFSDRNLPDKFGTLQTAPEPKPPEPKAPEPKAPEPPATETVAPEPPAAETEID
ncbi:hypothetical protein T484DRAFT_1865372 [Baffinella frigidus]|nr:hypothetical protein T484DRAFT_1865372 [Cryptophyta sp. CCMP2293]